jgi:hypothetical protein
LTQVDTPAERFTFVNNLVRTMKAVQFYEGGVVNAANLKTIYARDWIIRLAYAKYLNRTINPTTWDQPITSAEITAGRSLLAAAQAANQLQTSERLLQKVLGSKEFFSLQTQVGGPDAGLHSNRSWVDGVFRFYVRRGTAPTVGGAPTVAEVDTYSQKVLDLFETQRTTFINGIINGAEYKNLQADKYYQIVFGRNATTAEKNSWRTSLANGAAYANLVAGLFGGTAFFNSAPTIVGGGSTASQNTWARAVLTRAYGLAVPPAHNDSEVLALETRANAVGRTRAALELVINGDRFRDRVINDSFQTTLGRAATAAELTAYKAFLASTAGANRWERIIRDIVAQGNVVVAGQTVSLQREFWEIAG